MRVNEQECNLELGILNDCTIGKETLPEIDRLRGKVGLWCNDVEALLAPSTS